MQLSIPLIPGAVSALLFVFALPAGATDPAWWMEAGTKIFDSTSPSPQENWAPINVGQLKHVAEQAKNYLDARLSAMGGAGLGIEDCLSHFTYSDNFAPANVGQLKNVAKPFYDRLRQIPFDWQQPGLPGELPSQVYPWTGGAAPENAAPANLGQLKNVFNFTVSNAHLADGDNDGLFDHWEARFLGSIAANPQTDADNDGLVNLEEFKHGTNPVQAHSDSDGIEDGTEVATATDPNSDQSHGPVLRLVHRDLQYSYCPGSYEPGRLITTKSWEPGGKNEISQEIAWTALSTPLASAPTLFPQTLAQVQSSTDFGLVAEGHAARLSIEPPCKGANLQHRRAWLEVKPAPEVDLVYTVFRVTRRFINGVAAAPELVPVQFTIPKDSTASAPQDLLPGFTTPPPPGTTGVYTEEVDEAFMRAGLAVDASGDGRIGSGEGRGWAGLDFWINDDSDGPGEALDHAQTGVQGANDLVDFFPLFLELKELLTLFPPETGHVYRLSHGANALNFAYGHNLTRQTAFTYKNSGAFDSAPTVNITDQGIDLDTDFLNSIRDGDSGVLLMEGTAPTYQPLVLSLVRNGAVLGEVPLQLHLGPRILLLLHGINSHPATWNSFVNQHFGMYDRSSAVIRWGNLVDPVPNLSERGVRCYRLHFGTYDIASQRVGLESEVTPNHPDYNTINVRCGDFETFAHLGQEIDDAIHVLVEASSLPTDPPPRHPGAKIVLLGHSRGGIASRVFLQGSSSRRSAVVGLLTTCSPHLGSRMGRIYDWLNLPGHRRNQDYPDDWSTVDFLLDDEYAGQQKTTLDLRRPVTGDLSDKSEPILSLNAQSAVQNLPAGIRYGEIVYNRVALGMLTLGFWWFQSYSPFGTGLDIGIQLSGPTQTHLLASDKVPPPPGAPTPAWYPGDGLIAFQGQTFTHLKGFPAPPGRTPNTIPRLEIKNIDVVHSDAPARYGDLSKQLKLLNPKWFP